MAPEKWWMTNIFRFFSEGRKACFFQLLCYVSGRVNPFLLVLNPNHEMKHTKPWNLGTMLRNYYWWFRNPAPFEVGSLSLSLQIFLKGCIYTSQGGWPWDFWIINSMTITSTPMPIMPPIPSKWYDMVWPYTSQGGCLGFLPSTVCSF